jgi:serine/threonine-protein kinase
MRSLNSIERPLFRFASTVTSFEEEQRELLDGRLKLVFLLGFAISLAVHFFYASVVELTPQVSTPLNQRIGLIYDLYLISMGVATALVFVRRWSLRYLLAIDYTTMSFVVLLSLFIAVVFDGNEVPAFAISLILFIHAAFIPVPIASQFGLAATATLGLPAIAAICYALIPGVQEYWAASAAEDRGTFETFLLEGTFQIAILAVVSVLITKALYHLRRSLHKAKRLGNYLIKGELGKGGMGQVYIAEHALICRPAAVKVMEAEPGEGPASLARFEREVRLSATLTHPNTIMIYDYGRGGRDTFYYAMEYLEGLDLQQLVERFGPVSPERTAFILAQACGSLAEAHSSGIVHRDVKPSNIFLTSRGGIYDFVKVLDFGLAKQIESKDAGGLTQTGMLFGTPRYLSPETVSGSEKVDGRGDLYCLGAVGYWMMTGKPPFDAGTCVDVIIDHVKTTPKRPSEVTELPIPAELEDIVLRCLEKKPEVRFQTALELESALKSVPFAEPWTRKKAAEWWELHLPESSRQPVGSASFEEPSGKPEIPVP